VRTWHTQAVPAPYGAGLLSSSSEQPLSISQSFDIALIDLCRVDLTVEFVIWPIDALNPDILQSLQDKTDEFGSHGLTLKPTGDVAGGVVGADGVAGVGGNGTGIGGTWR
jgi:hypothetical protein